MLRRLAIAVLYRQFGMGPNPYIRTIAFPFPARSGSFEGYRAAIYEGHIDVIIRTCDYFTSRHFFDAG